MRNIELDFKNIFEGELIAPNKKVKVGLDQDMLGPYDMLLGGLGSCLYSTILDETIARKVEFEKASIEIKADHKEEIPTTLEWVDINISFTKPNDEKELKAAVDQAAKNCSIHQTIAMVANINLTVEIV